MERNEFSAGANVTALKRRLIGQKLRWSKARGKQMLFVFRRATTGFGIHLGMSGKMRVEPAEFRAGKHDHLVLQQKERALVFRDARQFGRVRFHHGKDAPAWWQASAPEILSQRIHPGEDGRFRDAHARAPIKAVLLLQSGFPGIGNWMADEILWRARIAPDSQGGKLTAGTTRSALAQHPLCFTSVAPHYWSG